MINEHIGSVDRHDYFVRLSNEIIKKAVSAKVGTTFTGLLSWGNDDARCFKYDKYDSIKRNPDDLRCYYEKGDILYVKEECAFCKDSPFTLPHYYVTDGVLTMDVRHDAGLLNRYNASEMPLEACRIVLEVVDRDFGLPDYKDRVYIYNVTFKVLKNRYFQKIEFGDLKPKNNQSILEPVKDGFDFTKMFEKARKTSAYKEQTMLCEWSDAVYNAMQKRKVDKAQLAHLTNIPYDKIVAVIKEEKSFTLEEYSKIAEALKCNFRLTVSYDKEE